MQLDSYKYLLIGHVICFFKSLNLKWVILDHLHVLAICFPPFVLITNNHGGFGVAERELKLVQKLRSQATDNCLNLKKPD